MLKRTIQKGEFSMLVAVDDSDMSKEVAKEAARIALERNAHVVLLSIVPDSTGGFGEIDSGYIERQDKEFQRLHSDLIDSYFKPSGGTLIESKVLHGDPSEKIVQYSNEMNADLVVVGTRGRGRLASTLLGSVSQHVANHSGCSVLIVKPSK